MAARGRESADVCRPGDLSPSVIVTVPDLHWLVHTRPAQLLGYPIMLSRDHGDPGPGQVAGRGWPASFRPRRRGWPRTREPGRGAGSTGDGRANGSST